MLYDVLSDFALASCISPFREGEKMARLLQNPLGEFNHHSWLVLKY
jgi:hypothetical protein